MIQIEKILEWLNEIIWSEAMLVFLVGTGLVFTVGLGFFQFVHHVDMWKSIFGRNGSVSGLSAFSSFCTTMAARIGTGNVAGVAVAIFYGGPGALFWMWIVGCTNAALSFVECTLGQLYKTKVDGEYRGSGAYCALRGLGWKSYGNVMAFVMMIGAGAFMPAAAAYTICDGFKNALDIPEWCTSLLIVILLAVIIIGGIGRIGKAASYLVPIMTFAYLILGLAIMLANFGDIPKVFKLIIDSAFNKGAAMGGIKGGFLAAVLQGVKRGTFSSAAGMGESTPAASAAECSHPVKQGMANAAGVFLDTIIVCTITGISILLTGCYNTDISVGGYQSQNPALFGQDGGIIFVQEAAKTVLGPAAPVFVSFILFLFAFTCIISYYYESETAAMFLLRAEGKEKQRKTAKWIIKISMILLTFLWGISESAVAWDAADFALGLCTWINVLMLWFLFPKARALYKDYRVQRKAKTDPCYDPDKKGLCWDGVDKELWRSIYKRLLE